MRQTGLAAFVGTCFCIAAMFSAGCTARKSAANSAVNPPAANQDFTITATWRQDFTNFAPCSATVTKGCVSGFTWGYFQSSTQVPLKTSAPSICAESLTAAVLPSAQPETCTDSTNATLGIGSVTFYVVANYVDNAGNAGSTSADESAQQNVSLVAPSALSVSWQ